MNELNNLVSIQIPGKDLKAAADHLKAVYTLLEHKASTLEKKAPELRKISSIVE